MMNHKSLNVLLADKVIFSPFRYSLILIPHLKGIELRKIVPAKSNLR